MAEPFLLITGRTSRQGCGVSLGKFAEDYRTETSVLRMAPEDLARLGLTPGDRVRLTSDSGSIEVPLTAAEHGELPCGLLFIAYGDLSSRLMGADTHASGMPSAKGIDVLLETARH